MECYYIDMLIIYWVFYDENLIIFFCVADIEGSLSCCHAR